MVQRLASSPIGTGAGLTKVSQRSPDLSGGADGSTGITISNAQVAFDVVSGGLTKDTQSAGSLALIDVVINDTPIGIRSSTNSQGSLHGSLILNNVKLNNVPTAVAVADGTTILAGSSGSTTIESWGQGNVYSGTNGQGKFVQDNIPAGTKDASLLDSAGRIVGRGHPQYADYDVSQFASARAAGAKGDGVTDDTATLQKLFDAAANCQIVFLDAGVYYVTDTLKIPVGTRLVGEAWSVIMAGGSAFNDQSNPKVAVQVGASGDKGVMEISDVM
jgi:glucan 1,3-beta-glucosidase